jgi:uncharacterized protein involved in type VI secretion and phage assembly
MAGKERGIYFIPEEGDEVLVVFEHGNVSHPYIIGSLWNGKDKPPETIGDGKNNIRMIRSRSGHEFIFNDEQSKEKVVIKSKGGHTIILDDSSGGEKIEIKDKTGSNIVIIDTVKNDITVKCSMNLRLQANIIEIMATSAINIKSAGPVHIDGAIVMLNGTPIVPGF